MSSDDDLLALQRIRDLTLRDPLGEPLHDGRLPNARLADQDGVVLAAAGENLLHAADLLVPADHGVELPAGSHLREVRRVLLQDLVALLRGAVGHALFSADTLQGGVDRLGTDLVTVEDPLQRGIGRPADRKEKVLDPDELVAEPVGLHLGPGHDRVQARRDVDLRPDRAGNRRLATQEEIQVVGEAGGVHPHLLEDLAPHAFLGGEDREHVLHVELVLLGAREEVLRLVEELLRALRQFVEADHLGHLPRLSSRLYVTANSSLPRSPRHVKRRFPSAGGDVGKRERGGKAGARACRRSGGRGPSPPRESEGPGCAWRRRLPEGRGARRKGPPSRSAARPCRGTRRGASRRSG